ncbi:MAG: class I SAM-dependent methyltransferase [Desulfatiglandales bacterium]
MILYNLTMNIRRTLPEAEIVETVLPLWPALKLYLIEPHNVQRAFSRKEIALIQANPPYWSLCWASGHALAHFIFENKKMFEGKSVLDFGTGSGVTAIAVALAGARRVTACDVDQDAIDAARANAALNRVYLETSLSLEKISGKVDMIVASDILYDRENLPILEYLLDFAPDIIVAESRVKTIDVPPYQKIAEMEARMVPDLDPLDPYRHVKIYRALL